jgi:DNA polymerase family B
MNVPHFRRPIFSPLIHFCLAVLSNTGESTNKLNSAWDPIAGNTGTMMFCCESSFAWFCLDLGRTTGADEIEFEGGFVLEPKPGCYKGVIVIDGNSLYGSIIWKLGVFIDRCASAPTLKILSDKMGYDLSVLAGSIAVDDVLYNEEYIVMRHQEGVTHAAHNDDRHLHPDEEGCEIRGGNRQDHID